MYPIAFDLSRIHIVLVGTGEVAKRRLQQLKEAGATRITFYSDHLPQAHEIRQAQLLMVAGLDDETSAVLASIARLQGIMVNVEDKPDLCDFYFMSFVKRGALTLAISTDGASPTLAQEIKAYLANLFGEEWAGIVAEIGERRQQWKQQGLTNQEVGEKTRTFLYSNSLMPKAQSLISEEAQ